MINLVSLSHLYLLLASIGGGDAFQVAPLLQNKLHRQALSQLDALVKVGVVDTPLDPKHKSLKGKMAEKDSCQIDDESHIVECKKTFGWNFNDESLQQDFFAGDDHQDFVRYIRLSQQCLNGEYLSGDDLEFYNEKSKDEVFLGELDIFVRNSHGTHVAAIISKDNKDVRIEGLDFIPYQSQNSQPETIVISKPLVQPSAKELYLLKQDLEQFSKLLIQRYLLLADYLRRRKFDIINGSFGTEISGLLAKLVITKGFVPEPSLLHELNQYIAQRSNKKILEAFRSCNDTLFVFAAGNLASDNDHVAQIPANTGTWSEQVMVVAAVDNHYTLAPFSNFGKQSVDIAAPGVHVLSGAPNDLFLRMSGTSQAAPAVSRAASLLKSEMPELKAHEVKKILMESVDHFDHLKDVVRCSGVLNTDRAMHALKLYQSNSAESIEEACSQSYELYPEKTYVLPRVRRLLSDTL